jgi:hypothetical protein
MTFQPPPPPPPGGTPPPPPPPPPPPGGGQPYGSQPGQPGQQWGAPPPAAGGGFNPSAVNPLDWAILAIGLLTFIFSTFSYYKVTVSFGGASQSATASAWHGFFGWFAVLLALVGAGLVAVAVFQPAVKLPIAPRLASLFAFALASLSVILAIFIIPGSSGGSFGDFKVDKGHGFAFWIDLILILGGTVLTLMRAQQTGTELPGALNKMPKIGS